MTSDQMVPGNCAGSESPIALTATTEIRTAKSGPLPGVVTVHPTVIVQLVVDRIVPPVSLSVTRYSVIGELLNNPGAQPSRSIRSPNSVTRTAVTGSGTSCTESVTVPHIMRSTSPVASATWYCSVTSTGSAVSETVTESRERSALGEIAMPAGRAPPSSPRIAMTRSGTSGNGLVAASLASTSTTVVCPRLAIAASGAGRASGLVEGTTR